MDELRISGIWLADQVGTGGSGNITQRIAELIRSGELAPGSRLPTVKDFAQALGVGAGLVATAWSSLRLSGLIETRRRGGTVVAERRSTVVATEPVRQARVPMDLARGVADPALLPDLAPALLAGLKVEHLNSPHRDPFSSTLRAAVEPTWPFAPASWLVVSGATEGMLLSVAVASRENRVIAIEEPVSARILFALTSLNLRILPVACDGEGPRPDALEKALAQRPAAFVYQIRHHNPLGHSVTSTRSDALAAVLQAAPEVVVIEDDFLGPLADTPIASLGERLPGRVVLVRGYCTSFGIDLKTAVVGGPAALLQQMHLERAQGLSTHSHILQGALAHLLGSAEAAAKVDRARATYRARAALLRQALQARKLQVSGGDGLVLWVEVHDETRTLLELARQGATLGAGSHCHIAPGVHNRIRVAVTHLPEDPESLAGLADAFAAAQVQTTGETYDF